MRRKAKKALLARFDEYAREREENEQSELTLPEAGRAPAENLDIEPGVLVPGEGIYLGQYAPKDEYDRSLGKNYKIFAAPEDMTNYFGKTTFTYNGIRETIRSLKNWHGFDGNGNLSSESQRRSIRLVRSVAI